MVNPPIQMANLGMADSLILMVMALVVFGPRRLPQIGRQIGKLMYEFRKASNDFKFQMEEELRTSEDAERRQKEEERQRALVQPPAAVESLPVVTVTATETGPSQTIEAIVPPASSELPSPDDGVYPQMSDPGELAAPSTEIPGEEPHLRIMPPSIGEQVPAARPNSHAIQADLFAEPATHQSSDADAETSQAANHG
jgi:sec-independent protein translocase protein TatB